MGKKITITVSDMTRDWLERESAAARETPTVFLKELLAGLADPDRIENELIDQLLGSATGWFPPLMDLDEQAEIREEILDSLCHQIDEQFLAQIGEPLTNFELTRMRARLADRAEICWRQK